ncbi:MAG: GntR family transcriptional regulator [candidate division NC10 bacterium]
MTGAGRPADWPGVEPIKSARIYEEIVRQVKQLIAEGKLKSGDRLPPERDLAEKFVVSRTSVREALRALESRGLIEIRAGDGAFVRDISVETLIEPLALVILPHREAVGELFEARRLLEPAIATLAARRATPEEIAEMERILEAQGKEVAEGARVSPRTRPSTPRWPAVPTTAPSAASSTPSWIC